MFLNTLVIDTYMENKEVWVVVLVLGFVLLLNSNSFTGQSYAVPTSGARMNALRDALEVQRNPQVYTTPTYLTRTGVPERYSPEREYTYPKGSDYSSYRYGYGQDIYSSPSGSDYAPAGLTPEAGQYSMQYDRSVKYPIGDKSSYRFAGQGVTPPGYRPTDPTSRNY